MKEMITTALQGKWRRKVKTMRKVLLLSCIAIATGTASYAQFTEGFESGIPATWTVINGGNPNTWTAGVPNAGSAYAGTNSANIIYDNDTAHDDYLITRPITVTAGVSDRISFWAKNRGGSTIAEAFNVKVSTTGTVAANFTTTLASATVPPTSWTQYSFNLSAYVGQTIYIAVQAISLDKWELYLDEFVVDATPPAPSNDNAAGATPLTVNSDYACAVTTNGTTVNATQSNEGGGAPSCNGTGINDDVWYTFTASNAAHRFVFSNVTTGTMAVALYTGTPGNLTAVASACNSGTTIDFTGLTPTTQYYARVFTTAATNTATSFTVCIGTPPPPPANDNASGAIALTVNADYNCGVTTNGTTVSATASTEGGGSPSCSSTGINDDVWYTFTGTNAAHRFVFSNVTTGTMAVALYTGTPGNLTAVASACNSGATIDFTGLIPATLYYARLYTTVATASTVTSFTVCVGTPPPPPANDDAPGAIALTVNADYNCGVTTNGTTISATASTEGGGNPSCSSTGINDDVWYIFTATNAAHRFVFSNVTTGTMAIALYTGTPGNLTAVASACNSGTTIDFTGLTPTTPYYARVYTTVATAATVTNFTVCLGTAPVMNYVSSTTTQAVTSGVVKGTTNQQIIGVEVVVTGSTNPLSVTQLNFNTTGTTSTADITSAKVYYTTTSTFSTTTAFGSPVLAPNGAVSVTGNQVLNGGGGTSNTTNYFWLVYDVPCAATTGNVLDAQYTGGIIGSVTQTPTSTNPTGTRTITLPASYTTVADGSWNNPATWPCGIIPADTGVTVNIANNITVNTTGNVAGNVTIATGGTLTIASGDLTLGGSSASAATGSSNKALIANGTLTITGGTLNLNGAFTTASTGTFNMSGGIFNIDPNDGTAAGSATTGSFYINGITATTQLNVTGGNINFLDPPYVSTAGTNNRTLAYNTSTIDGALGTGCTVTLGGGDDVNASNTSGFYIESNVVTGTLEIGTLVVNGGRFSAGRHMSTYTINNYITKARNLTINPGAELVVNAAVMAVTGNVVNNGVITTTSTSIDRGLAFAGDAQFASSAVTLYNSSIPQSLTGTGFFKKATADVDPTAQTGNLISAFSVWQAAGAAGFTLGMPLTVTSQLRLNEGAVNTTATNLLSLGHGTSVPGSAATLTATAGTIYGNSTTAYTTSAAYVGGWINGPFRRWVPSATTTGQQGLFPVGTTSVKPAQILFTAAPSAGGYLTATWTPANGLGTVSPALTEPAVTPNSIDKCANAIWEISNSGTLTGGTYTARFTDPASAILTSYTNTTLLKRANAAALWALEGTHVATSGSNTAPTISRSGLTTFSQFTIGAGGTVLPVTLKDFSGRNAGAVNHLNWETTMERNFSHFELERSADGVIFSKLATINADKQANGSRYAYLDEQPIEGLNIYRLNMVDIDGQSALSNMVKLIVKTGSGLSVSVHPNPVKQQLNIAVAGKMDGKGRIDILDIMGKVLQTVPANGAHTLVDMSSYAAGTYLIRYTDDTHHQVTRISKN